MRKSTLKMTALFISVMIIAAVAGACATKGNDSAINTAGISNATKAATTTKTATKAVTVSAAASAAKTTAGNTSDGTPAGGGTDMAGAGATGTGTIDDNEGQDNTDGMAEDSSGDGGSQTAEEKTFDLKGRKILVIASPLTQAWQNPVPDPADKVNDLRYRRMKEAEELFNCTFVFEQPAGMTTPAAVSAKFYQNIMAGVYWGDIFRMGDNNVFPAFEKALFPLYVSESDGDYGNPCSRS